MEKLSEEENVKVNKYIENYNHNVRLNNDELHIVFSIMYMNTNYQIYFIKKDEDNEMSNRAIKNTFDTFKFLTKEVIKQR